MKKNFTPFFATCFCMLLAISTQAQLTGDGHAYMKGDYVEVGINAKGNEGAPTPDSTYHYRSGTPFFGFVANPQMDGWVDFNGDFFAPGTPECGFGLGYTLLGVDYDFGNNYDIEQISGSITSFVDTPDSVITTWTGIVDSLQLTLVYELKKDELFYTTTIALDNIGSETYTNVYYYHNFDADNNQPINGMFSTQNKIESQSGMADDSVKVVSSQDTPWTAEVILHAYGTQWKGFTGGFSNRIAADMWNGTGTLTGVEGTDITADQAIGLAYKIETLAPGKAGAEVFSFATAFDRDIDFGTTIDDTGIDDEQSIQFSMYPNPSSGELLTISTEGTFTYTISDLKGSTVLTGIGNKTTTINLSGLESGVYSVQIEQDGQTGIQRLVIN